MAWKGLGELVDEGDICYLADGAVRLRVKGVTDGDVNTEVEVGGSVASRQGINLPNLTVSLPAVSEDDLALVDAGLDMGLDFLALSFVRRREDLEPVREHLRARGRELPLIAKIEKPQAAANAEEIVEHADGVMIARGDLGIELPIEEVPLVQKRILAMAGRQRGAHHHRHPDARVDGPVQPAHAGRGGRRGQRDLRRHRRRDALPGDRGGQVPGRVGGDDGRRSPRPPSASCPTGAGWPSAGPQANNQYHAIAFGAVGAVYQLGLKAIVSPTRTGTTVRLISAYRPRAPVLALSMHPDVVRQCCLLWGVQAMLQRRAPAHHRADRPLLPGGQGRGPGRGGRHDRDHRRPARRAKRRDQPVQGPRGRVSGGAGRSPRAAAAAHRHHAATAST